MRFIVMFIIAVYVLFLIKLRWPKKKSIYEFVNDIKHKGNSKGKGFLSK